jgi:hypothetical protein
MKKDYLIIYITAVIIAILILLFILAKTGNAPVLMQLANHESNAHETITTQIMAGTY